VNEEDGLDFRVLQQTDGSQSQLQVFWQDTNITNSTTDFEQHVIQHPLKEVFLLRAVCILQDRFQEQLERLYASEDMSTIIETSMVELDERLSTAASKLRYRETTLLEKAFNSLNVQKSSLIESTVVVAYFRSLQSASNDNGNDAEDFS
jgi:hypothetical protein